MCIHNKSCVNIDINPYFKKLANWFNICMWLVPVCDHAGAAGSLCYTAQLEWPYSLQTLRHYVKSRETKPILAWLVWNQAIFVGRRTSVVHQPATFMQLSTPSSTQMLLTLVGCGLFQLKVVRPKSCGHKHKLPLTNIFEFVSTTSCHPVYWSLKISTRSTASTWKTLCILVHACKCVQASFPVHHSYRRLQYE